MKTLSIVKTALGAARCGLLAAAPAAQARTGGAVPGRTPALIAAINVANGSGGAMINLAFWGTYRLTAASRPDTMPGDPGLPVITSPITPNGFHTTTVGNNSSFWIPVVTGSGKLPLRGLTLTGGYTPGIGHRWRSAGGHRLNRPFPELRSAPASARC